MDWQLYIQFAYGWHLDNPAYFDRPSEKLQTRVDSAWSLGIRSRSNVAKMLPITNLVFNFTPPASEDQPALLTFTEVMLLFQKVRKICIIVQLLPESWIIDLSYWHWTGFVNLCSEFVNVCSSCVLFQFGNGLQHLLTTVPYTEASGMTNIEWDAVEVCSNFMQNWYIVITCHIIT